MIPIGFFILFMHFEDLFKLLGEYHPIVHGLKYFILIIIYLYALKKKLFKKNQYWPYFLLYSLIVAIQILNPLTFSGKGILLSFIGIFYHLAYIPLIFYIPQLDREKFINLSIKLFVGLAMISASISYIQYFYPGNYFDLMPYNPTGFMLKYQDHYGPFSLGTKPPAIWYLIALLLIMTRIIQGNFKEKFYMLIFIFITPAFVMTFMREPVLLGVIGFLCIFFFNIQYFKNKIIYLWGTISLFLFGVTTYWFYDGVKFYRLKAILDLPWTYFEQRGYTWLLTPKIMYHYPFGLGLRHGDKIPPEKFGLDRSVVPLVDNYWNRIIAELSFVGLFIFTLFVLKTTNLFFKKNNHSQIEFSFFVILFIVLITGLHDSDVNFLFWYFLGGFLLVQDSQVHQDSLLISRIYRKSLLHQFTKNSYLVNELIKGNLIVRIDALINYVFKKNRR